MKGSICMKRKNILRAKKYMNNKSNGRVFEKRLNWLLSHVSLHLKGIHEGEEYDIPCQHVLAFRPNYDTRLAPHIHWAAGLDPWEPSVTIFEEDDDVQFIDELCFVTRRSDTARVTNAWARVFWLR